MFLTGVLGADAGLIDDCEPDDGNGPANPPEAVGFIKARHESTDD
jgi:hypothetical protein